MFRESGWYLTDWQNDALWNKHYYNRARDSGGKENEIFLKKYPTMDKFRNFCFESSKNKVSCEPGMGGLWCDECARNKKWDEPKVK